MTIIPWTTKEIIYAVNGHMPIGNLHKTFNGISIDSRKVLPGNLFVAITGNNYKGVRFIDEALKNGALGLLVEYSDILELDFERIEKHNTNCIFVRNTIYSLGNLAKFHRNRTKAKVIGITGSIGKTTTQQMISNIAVQKYSTISTMENMNNHIGLPLTILRIEDHHRVAIVELGMSNLGEIKRLSEISQPDIGVITNVAPVHLETLGSMTNIANAKSELMEHMNPTGTIILNADDPFVRSMSKKTKLNVLFFGIKNKATILGTVVSISNKGIYFLLKTSSGTTDIKIPIPSEPMMKNALAASAVAVLLDCSNKEIKKGIESFKPKFGRMKHVKIKNARIEIIDDTYNSNPVSLKSALKTVNILKKERSSIAVLGDMLELGEKSISMHIEVGRLVAQTGIDRLYAVGDFAKHLVEGALLGNMPIDKTYIGNKQNVIESIRNNLQTNCIILIKGSRKMKMEEITMKIIAICNKRQFNCEPII